VHSLSGSDRGHYRDRLSALELFAEVSTAGPLLEKSSGLMCRGDFPLGYSPTRINAADKLYRLENQHY
jgi:hypothetical protein